MNQNSFTGSGLIPSKKSESIKVSLEDSSNKCQICFKKSFFKRNLTCQVCLNVFCPDHCTKKRHLIETNDWVNVCDKCFEEESKKEILNEINSEIRRISEELEGIKEGNDKLFKEHYNNTASINNLEMEIKKQEWSAKKQEDELLALLENEQAKGRNLRMTVDIMRKALDEASKNEKFMSDSCIEAEAETEILKIQIASLNECNHEIVANIEKCQDGIRGSLGIDQLRKILCSRCLKVINSNLNKDDLDIDPGDSVSVLSYSTDKPKKECMIV
jgi:septal ring factor EnvC (AmiA/AmiB activator)